MRRSGPACASPDPINLIRVVGTAFSRRENERILSGLRLGRFIGQAAQFGQQFRDRERDLTIRVANEIAPRFVIVALGEDHT